VLLKKSASLLTHFKRQQIVKRGSLPPPTRLSPPTKTRTLPSHSRPSSLLRPISEVEPLRPIESSSQSQQRRASSDFVTAVKMRLDSGRRKVFRRKSTGEADLVVQAASTATASMASRSPSSISMKEGGNGSAWYFQERAATAAKVGGDESSRGLSTAASTKIKKQKKQQVAISRPPQLRKKECVVYLIALAPFLFPIP
jgi:hypothetical protein